jgi:hypothetical protein
MTGLMDDKRSKGVTKFKQMSPKGEEVIRTLLEDTAPGTYHQILEVAFGDPVPTHESRP